MIRPATNKELTELGDFGVASPDKEVADKIPTSTPPTSSIYDGDVEDENGPLNEQWQTLNIPSPAFLVGLYNKHFRDGAQKLYEWQKEQLGEIGEHFFSSTLHNPYRLALCAANGSGKDYIVVAPTVVWASLVSIRTLTIITSSSGSQLTAQTENYIKSLCEAINDYHQQPIFRIRQRFIKCNLSGSEIRLFATDEAGKAEGYHPLEPDAKMLIIVNEAKNVSEDIFGALRRCTGFTHWLNVSTPGEPSGSFYRSCTKPELKYRFRRVTCFDCPSHLAEEGRLADAEELGTNSALYRSKHLALFTSLDSDSLVTLEVLEALLAAKAAAIFKNWPLRIGGDIAAGGDENALCITRGNMLIKERAMREKDTVLTTDWFEIQFQEAGISKDHEYIFMDDGGIGHAVIDMLVHRGWNIRRVRNETRALRPIHYGNRGAELWYAFKRFCEEKVINLDIASVKLQEQIISRQYKKSNTGGRIFLESKKEAKSEGRPSPDRADALVLSFTGLTIDDFLRQESPIVDPNKPRTKHIKSEDMEQYLDDQTFGEVEELPYSNGKRIFGSLTAAMPRMKEKAYGNN